MRAERILLVAGLALGTGCYAYVPARMDALQPGQDVRVRLSAAETDRLEAVRRSSERLLEGTVLELTGDELTVNTPVSRLDPMSGTRVLYQTLDVPVTGIVEVELRERDRVKTAAAIGAVAVAVGVGVAAALKGGGGEGEQPGPGPQEGWVPLRLRFGLPF